MKMGSRITLTALMASAVLAAVGFLIFFVFMMVLRTEYKEIAFQINESILKASQPLISCEGKTYPADKSALDFYDRFLLDRNTVVFGRSGPDPSESSIVLTLGKESLSFTGLEDGTISVCWRSGQGTKHYLVRSQTTFMQLSAYWKNYTRRQEKDGR